MKTLLKQWRSDKLKTAVTASWLLTVFFCFFGSTVLLINLPGLPALYPFRVLLPVTTLLHLAWLIREKQNPWKKASFTQRTAYVLCAVLLVYSTLSLFRAIDFGFTFTLWITLCFDLVFFALMIDLCTDQNLFISTVKSALIAFVIHMVMGIVEVFRGGFFTSKFDEIFFFFGRAFASPSVSAGNPNDYAMMLVFMLALLLLYWAWWGYPGKKDWIPLLLIAPVYFLIYTTLGRLCTFSFWILMAAFAMYNLTSREKIRRILIPVILVLAVVIGFLTYGRSIPMPAAQPQQPAAAVTEQMAAPAEIALLSENVVQTDPASKPVNNEFVTQNAETGQIQLNLEGSGGVRIALLLHAGRCFLQSAGMGVGLGNTAQLARATAEARGGVWGIHCFLARMTADCGIWFIIPLLLVAFKLVQFGVAYVLAEKNKRDWQNVMTGVVYLAMVLIYPIASTAPGDAQNSLPMWLYLGTLVLFPVHVRQSGDI